MKKNYCEFCGLELENGKCNCNGFLTQNEIEKKTKYCDTCKREISIYAKYCPYCGIPQFIEKGDEHLAKELEGEYAIDCLEKNGVGLLHKKTNSLLQKQIKNFLLVFCIFIIILSVIFAITNYFDKKHEQQYFASLSAHDESIKQIENQTEQFIEQSDTSQPVIELKDTWIKKDGYFYCFGSDGNPVVDDWVKETDKNGNEQMYYFDIDGKLVVNSWIDGEYFVGQDGAMLKNTNTPDGAKVDENGMVIVEKVEELEKETLVYHETVVNEKISANVEKSTSLGTIKGVDKNKNYELFIKDVVQIKDTVSKGNYKCNIILYYPIISGTDEHDIQIINQQVKNMFTNEFKLSLEKFAESFSELPKNITLNVVEQKSLTNNKFTFILQGRLTPRHGLYSHPKFRFIYDRKEEKLSIKNITDN